MHLEGDIMLQIIFGNMGGCLGGGGGLQRRFPLSPWRDSGAFLA